MAMAMAMANRGIKLLRTGASLPLSARKLHKTAFYREIMQPQGWRHAVALCFWGEPPAESPLFVTSVYRGESIFLGKVVRLAGLEPATSWFVARRSIQLS